MNLLAIETATVEVGAAVATDAGILAATTARRGRRHVETLHPMIEQVLSLASMGLGDLDAIAVDVGPGLFTGLRVGIAAAQGLGLGLCLPVVASSSLEILLYATRQVPCSVAAVVDMRRGEIAWTVVPARDDRAAVPARPAPAAPIDTVLGSPSDLVAVLVRNAVPVLLVGDGARRFGDQITAGVCAAGGVAPVVAGDEIGAPPVASLALLGVERMRSGTGLDPGAVEPIYLRGVDAQVNWSTRDGLASEAPPTGHVTDPTMDLR